jgi:hypothetical protein
MNKRPPSIIVIACVYILVGAAGFAYHVSEFKLHGPIQVDFLLVEFVRLIAVVSGIFMLRGRNWARWLALAWIAFHVVVGALHSLPQLAIHALFCAILAYFLLRPDAARYFRAART